jgi:hypothetical protein
MLTTGTLLAEIILKRYDMRGREAVGKTHATTNLKGIKMKENYGSRVSSRFKELLNIIEVAHVCHL